MSIYPLARDSKEVVPNATKLDDNPRAEPVWERVLPDGYIHLYCGCSFWRWYVAYKDKASISPSVYEGPILAMERGQAAYDAIAAGREPEIDWTGETRTSLVHERTAP